MLIKILYVLLVLSTLALLWAVGAAYLRVRRHMSKPDTTTIRQESEESEQPRKKVSGED